MIVTGELLHKFAVPGWERGWKDILLDSRENVFLIGRDSECLWFSIRIRAIVVTALFRTHPSRVGILGLKEPHTEPLKIDGTLLVNVAAHLRQNLLVDLKHQRQRTLVNMEIRQNKVVNHTLEFMQKKTKVRVMAEQSQHDQIGIETIQTMADVRVVAGLRFSMPDVLHDLVFTFTWHFMAGKYNVHTLPLFRKLRHEFRAGSNAIAVKRIFLRHLNPLGDSLLLRLFGIQSCPKPSRALLIHFRTWGDTIHCHEEELLWFDLAVQVFDIVKDGYEHLILGHSKCRRVTVLVCAVVNNAVHVKIQIVELRKTVKNRKRKSENAAACRDRRSRRQKPNGRDQASFKRKLFDEIRTTENDHNTQGTCAKNTSKER
ncbi:hypothetical protein BDW71DRAFT_196794 [Aspergillus fruticulosus]